MAVSKNLPTLQINSWQFKICFYIWPHLDEAAVGEHPLPVRAPGALARLVREVLKPGQQHLHHHHYYHCHCLFASTRDVNKTSRD